MKNKFIILLICVFMTACQSEIKNTDNAQINKNSEKPQTGLIGLDYSANTESVKSGEEVELTFEVKDVQGGIIKDFEIVHEKPMHLLIVSEDLSEFFHIHPELQSDGKFKVKFVFPNGGNYRLYADFTPKNSPQIVKDLSQVVVGNETAKVKLVADVKSEKIVDGLRVVMKPDAEPESGKDVMLNFEVFDAATNQPVTDLENYLGEKAHFVIISEDLRDFVHAHPVSRENVKNEDHSHAEHSSHSSEEKLSSKNSEATVSAHVAFPNAAKYKIWAQFQRAGKVITVPFVVEVKQGKDEKLLTDVKIPDGAIKVVVSSEGFVPQEISFKKGQPLKLAFVRLDNNNCGNEVVFKNLNITKKLPVGEVVTVDVPTDKAEEINFTCGMDMFKGKIIVN